MDETLMKMIKMLDACEEVENVAAEIYYFFADHFQHDEKIARTWRTTALEEENHARQVNLAKKKLKSIALVSIDAWRQVFTTQKHFHTILGLIRMSPPTLEEALISSITLEEKMDHLHMMNAVMIVEKSGNDLFAAMMKEDQSHLLKLEELLADFLGKQEQDGTRRGAVALVSCDRLNT